MEPDDACGHDRRHQLMIVPLITCLLSKVLCVPLETSHAADAAEDDDDDDETVDVLTSYCPTLCTFHHHNTTTRDAPSVANCPEISYLDEIFRKY